MVAFPTVSNHKDFDAIASRQNARLKRWYNARIQVLDPAQSSATSPYDATTDTGGVASPVVIFDSGENGCRLQPIYNAAGSASGEQTTHLRGLRIQCDINSSIDIIRSGLRVVVINGGQDHALEYYVFTVESGINSSYAWNRTIECSVDLSAVISNPADAGTFPDQGLFPSG